MATKLTFQLKLEPKHPDVQTLALLSLDRSGDFELQDDELVAMVTGDGRTWTAVTTLDRPTTGTLFNVRFLAPVGTAWSFSARTDDGKVVYPPEEDRDAKWVTVTPKGQLGDVLL